MGLSPAELDYVNEKIRRKKRRAFDKAFADKQASLKRDADEARKQWEIAHPQPELSEEEKNRRELMRGLKNPNALAIMRHLDIKQRAIELKGSQCAICGYNKCLRALEFHHLDQYEKQFNISAMIQDGHTWDEVVQELEKCVLLCSNCHREVEAGYTDLPDCVNVNVRNQTVSTPLGEHIA